MVSASARQSPPHRRIRGLSRRWRRGAVKERGTKLAVDLVTSSAIGSPMPRSPGPLLRSRPSSSRTAPSRFTHPGWTVTRVGSRRRDMSRSSSGTNASIKAVCVAWRSRHAPPTQPRVSHKIPQPGPQRCSDAPHNLGWLCPTEEHRARMLDMGPRVVRARTIALAATGAGTLAATGRWGGGSSWYSRSRSRIWGRSSGASNGRYTPREWWPPACC
jgi:hypothetical protein